MAQQAEIVSLRITLRYATLDEFVERYADNVSSAGLFLRTKTPKPPGTRVRFELLLSDGQRALRGEGVIVGARGEPKPGMALRFHNLDPESQRTVERIVEAHGHGALAPTPLSTSFGRPTSAAGAERLHSSGVLRVPRAGSARWASEAVDASAAPRRAPSGESSAAESPAEDERASPPRKRSSVRPWASGGERPAFRSASRGAEPTNALEEDTLRVDLRALKRPLSRLDTVVDPPRAASADEEVATEHEIRLKPRDLPRPEETHDAAPAEREARDPQNVEMPASDDGSSPDVDEHADVAVSETPRLEEPAPSTLPPLGLFDTNADWGAFVDPRATAEIVEGGTPDADGANGTLQGESNAEGGATDAPEPEPSSLDDPADEIAPILTPVTSTAPPIADTTPPVSFDPLAVEAPPIADTAPPVSFDPPAVEDSAPPISDVPESVDPPAVEAPPIADAAPESLEVSPDPNPWLAIVPPPLEEEAATDVVDAHEAPAPEVHVLSPAPSWADDLEVSSDAPAPPAGDDFEEPTDVPPGRDLEVSTEEPAVRVDVVDAQEAPAPEVHVLSPAPSWADDLEVSSDAPAPPAGDDFEEPTDVPPERDLEVSTEEPAVRVDVVPEQAEREPSSPRPGEIGYREHVPARRVSVVPSPVSRADVVTDQIRPRAPAEHAPPESSPAPSIRMVGIDFGARAIRVASILRGELDLVTQGTSPYLPGQVAIRADGGLVFGPKARSIAHDDPSRAVSPRSVLRAIRAGGIDARKASAHVLTFQNDKLTLKLGERSVGFDDVLEVFFRGIVDAIAEHYGAGQFRAVISVPADLDPLARAMIESSCARVGLEIAALLGEPQAMLSAHNLQEQPVDSALLIDVGATHLGIGVARRGRAGFAVVSHAWHDDLSAGELDAKVVDLALEELKSQSGEDHRHDRAARAKLLDAVEQARLDIRRSPTIELRATLPAPGGASGVVVERSIKLPRGRIYQATEPTVAAICARIQAALREAGIDPRALGAIILGGGGGSFPPLVQALQSLAQKEPLTQVAPTQVFALGLAKAAAAYERESRAALPDALGASIGIELPGGRFRPLLMKGTSLPAKLERTHPTTRDHQTEMELSLYEGDAEFVRSCKYLGTIGLRGLPKGQRGDVKVALCLEVDREGYLLAILREPTAELEDRIRVPTTHADEGRDTEPPPPGPRPPAPHAPNRGLIGRLFGKK